MGQAIGHGHLRRTGFLEGVFEGLDHFRRHRLGGVVGHVQCPRQGRQHFRLAEVDRVLRSGQGKPRLRDVRQNAAEADRHQQQRLKALANGEVQEKQANADHHQLARFDVEQATACPERQ